MAQSLSELEALLQSLQQLKPPGVSKSKVDAITKFCTTAQVDRTQIIDVLIGAFTRSPPTHKLGILYNVDSVIRQYIAQGGNNDAVSKLTARIPSMLEDITNTIPAEQKPRLTKLLDIWLGSKTFSADMLNAFKQRLDAPAAGNTNGMPPAPPPQQHAVAPNYAAPTQAPAPVAPPPSNGYAYAQPAVSTPVNVNPAYSVVTPIAVARVQPQYQQPNGAAAYQAQAPAYVQNGYAQPQAPPQQYAQPPQTQIAPPPVVAQNQAAVAQNAQAPAAALPALNPAQLQAVQSVVQANPNITAEQLMQILAAMGVPLPAVAPPQAAPPLPAQIAPPPHYGHPGQDQQAYQRERSRSPDYKRRRVTPPGRQSPVYGAYDPNVAQSDSGSRDFNDRRDRGRGGKGGRDNVRKRSPPRERMASPRMLQAAGQNAKPYGRDDSLQNGKIRVLSRTLFVGGVSGNTNEDDLMAYISRYARVQSCIVNHDKRHAFLKLISHQDAINAKQSIDSRPEAEYRHLFERMNWAVGFGPTQFADYKKGESVLPIDVLTDADRKWMKSAEFGGTGGLEIMTGMVVEEPDIEIGAGPSSKAISRRGGKASGFHARDESSNNNHNQNQGGGGGRGGNRRDRGNRGGGGGNHDDHRGGQGRYRERQQEHVPMETHMPEPMNIGPPPPVPQFGALPFGLGQFR